MNNGASLTHYSLNFAVGVRNTSGTYPITRYEREGTSPLSLIPGYHISPLTGRVFKIHIFSARFWDYFTIIFCNNVHGLKAQKRLAQGKRSDTLGQRHVSKWRPVRAEALFLSDIKCFCPYRASMLWQIHNPGCRFACPGLDAFGLSARAHCCRIWW